MTTTQARNIIKKLESKGYTGTACTDGSHRWIVVSGFGNVITEIHDEFDAQSFFAGVSGKVA